MGLIQSRTTYPRTSPDVPKQEPFVQVPRFVLDRIGDLTGAELKVLLYVLRRTMGYGEDTSQVITCAEFQQGRKRANGTILEKGTGLSRAAVLTSVKGLVAKGLLFQEREERAPGYYVNRYAVCTSGGGKAQGTVHLEVSAAPRLKGRITWKGQKWRATRVQAGQTAALSSARITLEAFLRRLEQRRPLLQGAPSVKYGRRGWKKLREFIFRVDNFTCQYCGSVGGVLRCDHILPRSRGGSDDPTNLVTACLACNNAKGAKTPEEWLGKPQGRKGGR